MNRLLGVGGPQLSTALYRQALGDRVKVGERLDDFNLLALLGTGAFAHVFLAWQHSLQRLVALKVSAARGTEPQTLAQLDHQHIVRVYDQRLLLERGLCLLYMQHVPGGTLHGVIERIRRVPPKERNGQTVLAVVDEALETRGEASPPDSPTRERMAGLSWPEVVCRLGGQLAAALDHAHRQGVLHRDMKPANVLLTADAVPKLADFNISWCAKVAGATPAAYFGGSLAYMSPEQLEAFNPNHARQPDSLDGRSDLYSLGVLLWELLTGERPFPGEALTGDWPAMLERMTARRQAKPDATALASLPADCPPGLKRILLTCLAPAPEDRFASARELAVQLELCLHPRVQQLIHPRLTGLRRGILRFPLLALLLIGLASNGATAVLNFVYNLQEIVTHLEGSEPVLSSSSALSGMSLSEWGRACRSRAWSPATTRDCSWNASEEGWSARCAQPNRPVVDHTCRNSRSGSALFLDLLETTMGSVTYSGSPGGLAEVCSSLDRRAGRRSPYRSCRSPCRCGSAL